MVRNNVSIAKATVINGVSKYTNVFFQLLATAILARVLTPEDYGVVAIVTVFTTFFMTFSDIGLGAGIIQNKSLSPNDIDDVFSFSFYLSLGFSGLFYVFSYVISWFYYNQIYITIGRLLSISLFFNSLSMIPNACLMREKRFILTGVRTIIACLVSYSVAIYLAYKNFGYYALVWQAIIYAFVTFCGSMIFTKLKFKLNFRFASIKKIISYSSFNFGYDLLNYFVRNTDNLLTGKLMGSTMLGYYNKAYTLMLYPVVYLTNIIASVLHPILSDFQNDLEYIWMKYMKVFKVLSLSGAFISVYCMFGATEIVRILYGNNWDAAIPCVKILSISVWFQMTSTSCDGIYRSIGKTKLLFNTALVFIPIQLCCIVVGALSRNIETLSIMVTISYILKFIIITLSLVKRGFHKNPIHLYLGLLPEFGTAFITSFVMFFAVKLTVANVLLSAIFKFIICCICFIIGYSLTKQINISKLRRECR